MSVRQIVKKPLAFFKANNIRKEFDEESLRKLGESLMNRQMHPVVCLPDGTIIDGERRWRGAKLVGMKEIEVIIIDEEMSQTQLRILQAATVFHRADWTAGEKYDWAYELVQLHPDWQAKEIAEHLHVDQGLLSKLLTFSRTIPAVRQALDKGLLGIDDGYALSQVSEAEQAELLQQRLSGKISSREALRREVRSRKRPTAETDAPKVARLKAALPSGATITVAREGLDICGLIDALSELLKLAKKAERESWDVKTFEAVLKDQAKA
jgi:ParB/RepB/Spo0J family partition protein